MSRRNAPVLWDGDGEDRDQHLKRAEDAHHAETVVEALLVGPELPKNGNDVVELHG